MKKLYTFFVMAIIAVAATFQANASTMKMNVTGADLLNFEWYSGSDSYTPAIADGDNTIQSTDFEPDKTWFTLRIVPKKTNVNLTVTYQSAEGVYGYVDNVGKNAKSIYFDGDVDLTVVAEEYEVTYHPVHFEFVNPGTEDFIKDVYVDSERATNFKNPDGSINPDFSVISESKLYFVFDYDKYGKDKDADDNWCWRNGDVWDNPATSDWTSANEKITGETTYRFAVKANPVYDVNFKVNNPGSAQVSINNGASEILTETDNIKKVVVKQEEGSTQMILSAAGDYGIKSVKRIVDGQEPFEESQQWNKYYLYFKPDYGNCTYEIETVSKDELRTASCTVNIDGNADNIKITRNYVEITDLVNGDNTIKFNPNDSQEQYLQIATRDSSPFYQILVNGVKQSSYSAYSYSVQVSDQAVVEVKTLLPDTPAKLTFEFVNEGTEDFISSISVDEEDIDLSSIDFNDGLEVKRGAYVKMLFNTEKYKVNGIYVDNESQWSTYSWTNTVLDDKAFKFDVETYPTYTATINVDKPDFVCIRINSASYGDIFRIQPGKNDFSYTGYSAPTLYILPNNGGEIVSVKANGLDVKLDDYYNTYGVDIEEGMTIDIEANGPERDNTAMFWSDIKPADTNTYRIAMGSTNNELGYTFYPIDTDINYIGGYHTFNFTDSENPFRVVYSASYGYTLDPKIFLNNEEVSLTENGYIIQASQGDVVKVFIYKDSPATCAISFDVPAEIANDITVTSDRVRNEAAYTTGVNVLEGAEITIASSENANIKGVTVDGTAIDPNDDGSYTFAASANHNVVINAESGIIAIEGDNASSEIYNLQGIRVGSDLNALPAGIYIVNGKKILK